jgi:hypothetical protein
MSTADERCRRCDEDVSMRSAMFDERHRVERHGVTSFLCGSCFAELRASRDRRRRGMTEEERRSLENGANAFGAFAPGGH